MANLFSDQGIDFRGKTVSPADFRLGYGTSLTPDPVKAKAIVSRAEEYLALDIPLLPLSLYRDCSLTGNRWRFEGPHHRRREYLITLVLAEAYERKGRFTERIADLVWAICEETSWVIPAHTGLSPTAVNTSVPEAFREDVPCALDLYAGSASVNLAFALYLCGKELDEISPFIRERVRHLVKIRCIKPFLEGNFWWMRRMCNWATQITGSVLLTTAILEEDEATRVAVLDRAALILDRFVDSYPEDGSCDEGSSYWGGAAACLYDCLEIIYDLTRGQVNVFGNEKLKTMGEYITRVNIHGKYFVNFADCPPRLSPNGAMIMRFGRRVGSAAMEQFGRWAANGQINEDNTFRMPYRYYMDLCTPYIDSECAVASHRASAFPGRQLYFMREEEQTDKGFYIAIKGGHNDENHNHLDVGCFTLYSDGKPLVVDPGMGIYVKFADWFDRYTQWHFKSDYHNLPSFHGAGQYHGGEYCAKVLSFDPEGEIALDLSKAYIPEASLKGFIRKARIGGGRAVITDEVELDREGEIVFHLTLVDEPELVSPGLIRVSGRSLHYDPVLTPSVKPIEGGNFRYNVSWDRERLWHLSLSIKAERFTSMLTFD